VNATSPPQPGPLVCDRAMKPILECFALGAQCRDAREPSGANVWRIIVGNDSVLAALSADRGASAACGSRRFLVRCARAAPGIGADVRAVLGQLGGPDSPGQASRRGIAIDVAIRSRAGSPADRVSGSTHTVPIRVLRDLRLHPTGLPPTAAALPGTRDVPPAHGRYAQHREGDGNERCLTDGSSTRLGSGTSAEARRGTWAPRK
jgi:hypothetical protein